MSTSRQPQATRHRSPAARASGRLSAAFHRKISFASATLIALLVVVSAEGVSRLLQMDQIAKSQPDLAEPVYRQAQLERPYAPLDFVVLGSSSAASGIDPEILHEQWGNGYNASVGGAGFDFLMKWWEQVVAGNTDNVPVIVASSVLDFVSIDGYGDVRRRPPDLVDEIAAPVKGETGFPVTQMYLYRFSDITQSPTGLWDALWQRALGPSDQRTFGPYGNAAALGLEPSIRPDGLNTAPFDTDWPRRVAELDLMSERRRLPDAFVDSNFDTAEHATLLAEIINSGNVPVVVALPVMQSVLEESGFPVERVNKLFGRYLVDLESQGIRVVDLRELLMPLSMFWDPVHYSRAGATRVTNALGSQLMKPPG